MLYHFSKNFFCPCHGFRYYIKTIGKEIVKTGLQEITIEKRSGYEEKRSVSAEYYALLLGEKILLVKSSSKPSTIVEGEISPIPFDLRLELFDSPEMKEIENYFYPFYLEDTIFKFDGYVGIIGIIVFLFLFTKYSFPAFKYISNPSKIPAVKRVSSWGDPITTSKEIENEYKNSKMHFGNYTITNKYVIEVGFFSFDIFRFSDLLWGYKRVTKKRVNFIPAGKEYDTILIFYGGSAAIGGTEEQINGILNYSAQKAPWAVFGYTDDISKLFNKDTRNFCLYIEERKRKIVKG